jgi:hypothetical protein
MKNRFFNGFLRFAATFMAAAFVSSGCDQPTDDENKREPPSAPEDVRLIAAERQLTVTWEEAARAETYDVYYGSAVNTSVGTEKPEDPGENITRYGSTTVVINSLSNGTIYYVWVKAANGEGETWSEAVSGTPQIAVTPPETPKNVQATGLDGQLLVSWDAADGAVSYEVYFGVENPEKKAESAALSCIIGGLTNGTEYTVWVKAVNSAGSIASEPVAGTPAEAQVFDDLTELKAYFDSKPQNTAATPYTVALRGFALSDGALAEANNALGKVYTAAGGKYFSLDLSGCNGNLPDSTSNSTKPLLVGCILPDSMTSIGNFAFGGCISLVSISLPKSLESIGSYVFYGCTSLESISLPKNLKSIGNDAFYGCTSLDSISLPDSLQSIGTTTFYECSSLQSVTLPESLKTIGASVFARCSSLLSISLPNGLQSIDPQAFQSCSSLRSITLTKGLESIENYAFDGCSSLQSVTLPEGLKTLGTYVFRNCSFLQSISLPEGLKILGTYAFYGCSSLQSVILPKSLQTIGTYAFAGCSSLQSISLPEGLETIGTYAFAGCSSLQSIILQEGITSIGKMAFADCFSLTSVSIYAVTPPTLAESPFDASSPGLKFYVPADSVAVYKTASGWASFANQIYSIPTGD